MEGGDDGVEKKIRRVKRGKSRVELKRKKGEKNYEKVYLWLGSRSST